MAHLDRLYVDGGTDHELGALENAHAGGLGIERPEPFCAYQPLFLDEVLDLGQEPRIDVSQLGDALERPARAECIRNVQQPIGPRRPQLVGELVLVLIGLGLVGAAYWASPSSHGSTDEGFAYASVERGDLTETISATGNLQPQDVSAVGSELSGKVIKIYPSGDFNQVVKENDPLVELDPRNFFTLQQIALSYENLRRYAEAIAVLDRALAIVPDNAETRANRGLWYMCWKADTRPLHQTIDAILAQGAGAITSAADTWFDCALAERDPAAAERALVALGDNPISLENPIYLSRSFGEGLLARMTKDEARARTAFEAARAQQEKIVQAQPDYGPTLCVLGLIDAALGRKDLALDEGRRAIALTPLEKDVNNGSRVLQYFAITAAWAGEKELALPQLEAGLRAPAASQMLSYGALKLFPIWDPLRGDPRFEKIVASLAPKE